MILLISFSILFEFLFYDLVPLMKVLTDVSLFSVTAATTSQGMFSLEDSIKIMYHGDVTLKLSLTSFAASIFLSLSFLL
jgi:hypothetical protein